MQLIDDITIQIVLYEEEKKIIFDCLSRLSEFKVILVDNAGNTELKKKISENFKIFKYILNDKNIGFSKAHNQASKYVNTKFMLILNADCIIDKKNILILVEKLQFYENCSITSPTTYDQNSKITYNGGLLPENGKKIDPLDIMGDVCVQSVLGGSMCMKVDEFKKIGYFDENLFLFFSDDDLCRKFANSKKSILQIFSSKAIHIHGISKVKNFFKREFLQNYYLTLDELMYFSKIKTKNKKFIEIQNKITNYHYKFLINIFILNFKKVILYLSKILAYYKYKNLINK